MERILVPPAMRPGPARLRLMAVWSNSRPGVAGISRSPFPAPPSTAGTGAASIRRSARSARRRPYVLIPTEVARDDVAHHSDLMSPHSIISPSVSLNRDDCNRLHLSGALPDAAAPI